MRFLPAWVRLSSSPTVASAPQPAGSTAMERAVRRKRRDMVRMGFLALVARKGGQTDERPGPWLFTGAVHHVCQCRYRLIPHVPSRTSTDRCRTLTELARSSGGIAPGPGRGAVA